MAKKRLYGLVVGVSAVAILASGARGSVPTNLRAQVLKFGAVCHGLNPTHGDCSGLAPSVFKYLDAHPKYQPKGYSKLKAMYVEASGTCRSLKPSGERDAFGAVTVDGTTESAELACIWGFKDAKNPGVMVSVELPTPGNSLKAHVCDDYTNGYNGVDYYCSAVAGGVRATKPYPAIPLGLEFGEEVLDTASAFVDVRHWSRTQADYARHAGGDLQMFLQIAKTLGVSTR